MQEVAPEYNGKAWEQFKALIEKVVARWRSYVDWSTVEDLRQEARLGAWRALQTYDPQRGVAFSTYVYSCIDHAVLNAMQTYRHHHECLLSFEEIDVDVGVVAPGGTQDAADPGEWSPGAFLNCLSREELCAAFSALGEQDRQIIAWALGARQTDHQIAERMDKNEAWAKKRRQRALRAMGTHVEARGHRLPSREKAK